MADNLIQLLDGLSSLGAAPASEIDFILAAFPPPASGSAIYGAQGLRAALQGFGYGSGVSSISGQKVMDTQTRVALTQYQQARGLAADGVFGELTLEAMVRDAVKAWKANPPHSPKRKDGSVIYYDPGAGGNLLGAGVETVPPTTSELNLVMSAFPSELAGGGTNYGTRGLAIRLQDLGFGLGPLYSSNSGPKVFDVHLRTALKDFQSTYGLTADGIFGSGTLKALGVAAATNAGQDVTQAAPPSANEIRDQVTQPPTVYEPPRPPTPGDSSWEAPPTEATPSTSTGSGFPLVPVLIGGAALVGLLVFLRMRKHKGGATHGLTGLTGAARHGWHYERRHSRRHGKRR